MKIVLGCHWLWQQNIRCLMDVLICLQSSFYFSAVGLHSFYVILSSYPHIARYRHSPEKTLKNLLMNLLCLLLTFYNKGVEA